MSVTSGVPQTFPHLIFEGPSNVADGFVRLILTTEGQKRPPSQSDETSKELSSMKKEYVVDMPIITAQLSSYLSSLLQDRGDSREWKSHGSSEADVTANFDTETARSCFHNKIIRLTLSKTSTVSLDSLMTCLEYLGSKDLSSIAIDHHNQFQLLASAAMLKLPEVMGRCFSFIAQDLSTATVVVACKFAFHLNSTFLLKSCYYFLRSQAIIAGKGSIVPDVSTLKIDVLASKSRKQSIAADKKAAKIELEFCDDGTIRYGQNSIQSNMFAELSHQELVAKTRINIARFMYDLYYVDESVLGSGSYPRVYRMFHDGNDIFQMMAYQHDEFSEFVITANPAFKPPVTIFDEHFLGIVSSNLLGTEFNLFDFGVNPALLPAAFTSSTSPPFCPRRQLCQVLFDRNVMGSHPRALRARVPNRNTPEDSAAYLPSPAMLGTPEDVMEVDLSASNRAEVADDMDLANSVEFVNKPPFWNEENECWMLDFFGRVNLASAKNFQLVANETSQDVYLMFGKMTETRYSLDFRHPISPLQAFGIALAGIARKLAVN